MNPKRRGWIYGFNQTRFRFEILDASGKVLAIAEPKTAFKYPASGDHQLVVRK